MLLKKAKHHKSNYKLYSKGFSPHYPLPGYLRHPVAAFEAITSWMLSISNCIILDHLAMILLMDTKDDDYPIIHRVLTIPGDAGFCPSTAALELVGSGRHLRCQLDGAGLQLRCLHGCKSISFSIPQKRLSYIYIYYIIFFVYINIYICIFI